MGGVQVKDPFKSARWGVFFSYLRLGLAHHETLENFLELCKLGGQVCRLLCDPLNLDIQGLL